MMRSTIRRAMIVLACSSCTTTDWPERSPPISSAPDFRPDMLLYVDDSTFASDPSELLGSVVVQVDSRTEIAPTRIGALRATGSTKPEVVRSLVVTDRDASALAPFAYLGLRAELGTAHSIIETNLTALRIDKSTDDYVTQTKAWLAAHKNLVAPGTALFRVDGVLHKTVMSKRYRETSVDFDVGVFAYGKRYSSTEQYQVHHRFGLSLSRLTGIQPRPGLLSR